MKSTKYLDKMLEKHQLKNDAQMCKMMGWSSARISQYRTGKNIMDNETCGAIALALEIDPMQIIMAADLDRAEKTGQKSFWEVFTQRTTQAASVALVGAVTLFLTPTPSEAAPILKTSAVSICVM